MAEPRRSNSHQHFAGTRWVEVDVLERERLRLLVGWRAADLAEYCGFDFHAREDTAGRASFLPCTAEGDRSGRRNTPQVRPCMLARGVRRSQLVDATLTPVVGGVLYAKDYPALSGFG